MSSVWGQMGAVGIGIVLMVGGSYLLVRGASGLALRMGVSELMIGATIVALGTSLPELVTTVVASARGQHGMALGNIVGSNIQNVVIILGAAVLILPITIDRKEVNISTVIFFVAASVYLLWCLAMRRQVTRLDGVMLLFAGVIFAVLSLQRRIET